MFLMKHFFSIQHSYDNWKSVFFLFSWQSLLEKQVVSSQSSILSIGTTVSLKNWGQADKD